MGRRHFDAMPWPGGPPLALAPARIDSNADLSRPTLNFPKELEDEFRRDYAQKSVWHFRLGIAIAITLWLGFGWLDNFIVPDVKEAVWVIRYAIVGPSYVLILLFTFS